MTSPAAITLRLVDISKSFGGVQVLQPLRHHVFIVRGALFALGVDIVTLRTDPGRSIQNLEIAHSISGLNQKFHSHAASGITPTWRALDAKSTNRWIARFNRCDFEFRALGLGGRSLPARDHTDRDADNEVSPPHHSPISAVSLYQT